MTLCAACGQPGHRYGRNEGAERFDPQACINGLLHLLETAERVWWCVSHNAEGIENHGGTSDECWRVVWATEEPEGVGYPYDLCRMVRRLLVDAPLPTAQRTLEKP